MVISKSFSSKFVVFFILLVFIFAVLVSGYQKLTTILSNRIFNRPQSAAPFLPSATPTPTPQASEVHSSDGTAKLIMLTRKNRDYSTFYSFVASDISGENSHTIFTKTLGQKGQLLLPDNSWSPDNKYVYLVEEEGESIDVFVFKASGETFSDGGQYLPLALLFKSKTGYSLKSATGWASPTLLFVTAANSTKGYTYWFDVDSHSFIQLL